MQRLRGQFQAVDVQSDRGASVRMGDQRIRVVDIDLALQQGRADLQEWLLSGRQLNGDQVALGNGQARALQDLTPLLRMREHHSHDRVVDRIDDRQRDDADLRALKPPDHVEQLPHAVFQKNRELADAWPTAARQRGEVGAGSFTGTHETNPWSSTGEVTLSASVFEVPVGAYTPAPPRGRVKPP